MLETSWGDGRKMGSPSLGVGLPPPLPLRSGQRAEAYTISVFKGNCHICNVWGCNFYCKLLRIFLYFLEVEISRI